MLRVENLHKSFDLFKAVNGATLTAAPGEIVAVIGPNGAGKTTLFNLIAGQLKPDQGQVFFREELISHLPAHEICRKGIARSFQVANIFPRLSVFRNVQVAVLARQRQSLQIFRAAHTLAADETNRILESVGLLKKARMLAGLLSHGDQRILEIAIALGTNPTLLILDEPTAGMSPEETALTMVLINKLAAQQKLTILFCEHDMEIVFTVAQRIMVMHQGCTIIQGTPDEVRANHAVQVAYLGGAS